jgi:HJR/Mrr/RecB family endonuclease
MHPEEMKRMPHRKFEELVAAIWDRLGYKVELQQQTRDGGIDVIAVRRAEVNIRVLIQCKRPEPHKKVSVEAVRSLLGVKTDQGGSKAILVTTVTFTPDAQQLLDRHRWELEGRDYDGLLDWLHRTAR